MKKWMLITVMFLGIITDVFSQTGTYSNPKTYVLGAMPAVVGNEYIAASIITNRAGLMPGESIEIPGDRIASAIERLWEMGLFSSIEIYKTRTLQDVIFLEIHVQELPKLGNYRFTGIKKSEAEDLKSTLNLLKGAPVNNDLVVSIKNKTRQFYVDKGFFNVQVDVSHEPDTALVNAVKMTVNIKKGEKIKIKSINFSNNPSAPDGRLKRTMAGTKEMVQIRWLTENDKNYLSDSFGMNKVINTLATLSVMDITRFVTDHVNLNVFSTSTFKIEDYEADKKTVIQYFNAIGYRDAQIASDTFYVQDNKLYIDIVIDQGKKYYFRNITWKGNSKYPTTKLQKALGIRKGDIFSRERMDRRLYLDPLGGDISSLYLDDGYLFFNAEAKEVRVDGDSIDFEIQIYEGPQAIIDKIIIKGNHRTKEHVLRRELRTIPGDKFSRSAIIRSQRELAALGYVNPETIDIRPIPHPESGTVDIEYIIEEKSNDQLELSLGWGGSGINGGLIGSAGVKFNNFSLRNITDKTSWNPLPQGDGQQLSFRLNTNGRAYQSYNLSFSEPWLGGKKPNSLTVGLYRQVLRNVFDTNTNKFVTNGVSLGYGKRLKVPDNYFSLITTVSYQNYQLLNWSANDFVFTNGNSNNLNLKLTLQRSDVFNPTYPRKGSSITLSGQWTPPYSMGRDLTDSPNEEKYKWVEFHKYRFNAEFYVPLDRKKDPKLIMKLGTKMGWLGYYNKTIGLSPFERFRVGGDGLANYTLYGTDIISLRGYDPFSTTNGDAVFGKFNVEVRYPFSLNPSATIYGLLFAEGGNSWLQLGDYDPFNLKRSVGFGVRAFLPMFGLIGFDYGIPFDDSISNTIDRSQGGFNYVLNNGKFRILLGFEPE